MISSAALFEFPSMGAPREDSRYGTRSFVHKKDLVFYTVSEDALIVLRVVYGGRTWHRLTSLPHSSAFALREVEISNASSRW
jgi:plasmid stabilization system protein ParE